MRVQFLLVLFALSAYTHTKVFSQTLADVSKVDELTWYGVDYSETRFMFAKGEILIEDLPMLVDYWSQNRETLCPLEFIRHTYRKKKIDFNTSQAIERNNAVSLGSHIVDINFELTQDMIIRTIISNYKFSGTGYGCLIVPESIDFKIGKAIIWVLFINNMNGHLVSGKKFLLTCTGPKLLPTSYNNIIEGAIKQSGRWLKNNKNH